MRLRVLRVPVAPDRYRGMHRLPVGAEDGPPWSLVKQASALEAMCSVLTRRDWSAFDDEVRRRGHRDELVALDDAPDAALRPPEVRAAPLRA